MDDSPSTLAASVFRDELVNAVADDALDLILLPTEQCNFRCSYCYEDFTQGRMSDETVRGVKALISHRASGLRRLYLSWFGGEPLLASDLVLGISQHAAVVAENNPEMRYMSGMTTNASLLTVEMARSLRAAGVSHYQITIDGPQQWHDGTRIRSNGRGTFEQILSRLTALRDSDLDLQILLRVHLTQLNAKDMPNFVRFLREEFLVDPRFEVLFKAVGKWGGPNDAGFEILTGREEQDLTHELIAIVNDDSESAGRIFDEPVSCYAARGNSWVIRSSGGVGKCTVALQDPANRIGQLRSDGSLSIDNELLRPWMRGWRSGDAASLSCPLVGLPRAGTQPTSGELMQIGVRPS